MIGDITNGNPKQTATLQAELLGVRAIVFVFGPVLGALLIKYFGTIRSVFALSSMVSVIQIYLATFLEETLSDKMRMSALDYSKIVPWNFLKLMTKSPKAFITSILYMITKATDGRSIGQIGTLIRTEQYDSTFGVMERSYISAYQTFCMIPGYLFARKIFDSVSVFYTFLMGHCVLIAQKYVQSKLTTLRSDYLIMTLAVAKPVADVSVINMLRATGKDYGFDIAELEGMISNLEETSYALAAPFWAAVYSNAIHNGKDSRLFHRGVCVLLLAQIGLGFLKTCFREKSKGI